MRRYAKWTGIGLGGLIAMLVLFVVILSAIGGAKVERVLDVSVAAVNVPSDAATGD